MNVFKSTLRSINNDTKSHPHIFFLWDEICFSLADVFSFHDSAVNIYEIVITSGTPVED